ncbi:hypothetical protein [Flavivirga spongiicola]|uniref:Uncharacterized protein n=1 Tax=Flavivirga spongiicola TaxID=421621 RepID=A0ABU7XLV2_9FLAO|nr:hypothetical protein [Flavivirga sp. MEBiC05379]MDO5981401.1 hypothetical protein [Flavivirga sp. MEBiC05379]
MKIKLTNIRRKSKKLIILIPVFLLCILIFSCLNLKKKDKEVIVLDNFSYISKTIIGSDEIPLHGLIFKEKDGIGKDAIEEALNLINEYLGNGCATVDENGKVLLSLTEKEVKRLPRKQRVFYRVINEVVASSKETIISISKDSEFVVVGSAFYNEIDISDVNHFGTGKICNKFSVFAHEIKEQQLLQRGKDKNPHLAGILVEEEMLGYTRSYFDSSDLKKVRFDDVSKKWICTGFIYSFFEKGSRKIELSVRIDTNNIVGKPKKKNIR